MKRLLLIGIGPGDPRQITIEAVEAMQRASVFFVLEKGAQKHDLLRLRQDMLARYVPQGGYRLVQVADPVRNAAASDYIEAVQAWHQARASLYAKLIATELQDHEIGAFLLWGEPTLYDSTLRILDRVRDLGTALTLEVIPGISSVQALAARHLIALNRIGEPLTVLPGRRLAEQARVDNVVVMLDGAGALEDLHDPDITIYWGAYLGTDDEVLISGALPVVKEQILTLRAQLRQRKGWIMDTFLLRREP